jgi:phage protein D
MSFVDLHAVSADPGYQAFWAPYFKLTASGTAIPEIVVRDIVQVTYKDDIKGIDSVELTVNNWDPAAQRCPYIGSETAGELRGGNPADSRLVLFEPGPRQMQVELGYVGVRRLLTTVSVTSMEPSFPSGGPPTLTVRALNVLHRLRRKQHSHAFFRRKPSQIARELATLRDGKEKRLPLPVELVPGTEEGEVPIDFVAQDNQYDIDFLLVLARRNGYDLVVVEGVDRRDRKREYLLFGPSATSIKPVDYRLAWGRSLVEFKPQLSTSNQIAKVTVRGWDRRGKARISATVDLRDPKVARINPDLHRLLLQADGREELVVDEPVFTVAEARRRALAILQDRLKQMVKATGTTVGLPDLRAGSRIEIGGVGARLGGTYFVTETTHTLGEGGYTTRFTARREDSAGRAGQ